MTDSNVPFSDTNQAAAITVLVTGAGGYIGTTLVPLLLDAGFRVRALDRFFFGADRLSDHDCLELWQADTRDLPDTALEDVDAVIDLAAVSNDPAGEQFPASTWSINCAARTATAKRARELGVGHYILPSSCSVYGNHPEPLDEDGPTRPLTHYARANLAAEAAIAPLASNDFRVTILRLATVFGVSPRMRFDLAVNAMTRQAIAAGCINVMRDGSQSRPFIHVRDVGRVMLAALVSDRVVGPAQVLNVGNEADNQLLSYVARRIQTLVQSHFQRPVTLDWFGDCDPRSYRIKCARARQALDWTPLESLDSGILEIASHLHEGTLRFEPQSLTLDWYRHLEASRHRYPDLMSGQDMLVRASDALALPA